LTCVISFGSWACGREQKLRPRPRSLTLRSASGCSTQLPAQVGRLATKESCRSRSILFISPSKDRLESCNNGCVELTFDCLSEAQTRDTTWHSIAIRPVRCHCVVGVRDGNDPRQEWNLA